MGFLNLTAPSTALADIAKSAFETGFQTTSEQLGKQDALRQKAEADAADQENENARNQATIAGENARSKATLDQKNREAQMKGMTEALGVQKPSIEAVLNHPDIYDTAAVNTARAALQSQALNENALGAAMGTGAPLQYVDPGIFNFGVTPVKPSAEHQTGQALGIANKNSTLLKSKLDIEKEQQQVGGVYNPSGKDASGKAKGGLRIPGFLSTSDDGSESVPKDIQAYHGALGKTAYSGSNRTNLKQEGQAASRYYPNIMTGILNGTPGYADYGANAQEESPSVALSEIVKATKDSASAQKANGDTFSWETSDLVNPKYRDAIVGAAKAWLDKYGASPTTPGGESLQKSYRNLLGVLGGDITTDTGLNPRGGQR